jgi:hypothetical protein
MTKSDRDTVTDLGELAAAVGRLKGMRVTDLGRTLNMVEVGFAADDGVHRLHVQTAFRVIQREHIAIASSDMYYPLDREADQSMAFDTYATQYDRLAKILTERLGPDGIVVVEAAMRAGGAFFFQIEGEARFEIFPAISGPKECWRLFRKKSDLHYVYPASSVREP